MFRINACRLFESIKQLEQGRRREVSDRCMGAINPAAGLSPTSRYMQLDRAKSHDQSEILARKLTSISRNDQTLTILQKKTSQEMYERYKKFCTSFLQPLIFLQTMYITVLFNIFLSAVIIDIPYNFVVSKNMDIPTDYKW